MPKTIALAVLLLAAPAAATTYVTPPVDVSGGDTAFCVVQNVTDQARTVTTRMWQGNPRQLVDEDEDVSIGPRATLWVMNTSDVLTGVYCEIEGLSKKLRGWVGVQSGGTTRFLLPAAK
jgi:hypothetical protein